MEFSLRTANLTTLKTPLLALPCFSSLKGDPVVEALDKELNGALLRLAKEEGFLGKGGQLLSLTPSTIKPSRVVLVGLGAVEAQPAAQLRTFAHRIGRLARDKGLARFSLAVPTVEAQGAEAEEVLRWLTEGARSGVYRFEAFLTGKRKPKKCPRRCLLVFPKEDSSPRVNEEHRRAVTLGEVWADSVDLVRDLVNQPSNELTPRALAERSAEVAEAVGAEVTLCDPAQIKELGMNLLAAVGGGSTNGPRFVHLVYRPAEGSPRGKVALVGKGVTFDSGGLSLKTAKGQVDMKCDMAGAAMVVGVIQAASRSRLPWELHGLIPMAENLPGGSAYRPGDVVVAKNGRSVEVLNTDAEGRLILADALSYAAELKPELIIDFATLTGACMVALGPYRAGLFGTDPQWVERYLEAAERAGEPLWQLPLAEELSDSLKSSVADLKNVGGAWGGAITAALFLKEFVSEIPWLHIDLGGPAFLDKHKAFYPKGGTGYGVLTVLELLRSS